MRILVCLTLIAVAVFIFDQGRDTDNIKDAKFIALTTKQSKTIDSYRALAMTEYSDLYEGVRKKIKWDIPESFLGKKEQPGSILEQGFYHRLFWRTADSHFIQGLETLCLIDALLIKNPSLTFQQFLEAMDRQPQYADAIQSGKLKSDHIKGQLLTMDSPEIKRLVLTTEETRSVIDEAKKKK